MIPFLTQIVAAGSAFVCTPTAVYDGDGPIWCAEGPKIRLAGIAAREMDGRCRPGQPCPKASATAARDGLAALVGRPIGMLATGHVRVSGGPLNCLSVGDAKGTRTAAWCRRGDGVDLSCAMVRSGLALRWKNYGGRQVCHRTSHAIPSLSRSSVSE